MVLVYHLFYLILHFHHRLAAEVQPQWLRNLRLDKRGPLNDSDTETGRRAGHVAPAPSSARHPPTKEYVSNSKSSSSVFGTTGRLGLRLRVSRWDSHPPAPPVTAKAACSAGWILGSPEFDCRRELQLLSPNHVRRPVMFPEHLTAAGSRVHTRGPGARPQILTCRA